ncbi:MAG: creatininase family protein [Anaerolineaceae bacterium]
MNSNFLMELTRDEIKEKLDGGAIAILPIGAVEQHGNHLPLGTDNYLANIISNEVANQVNGVILPGVPFGYSWVWQDIPGTITIQHHNLELYLLDIFKSVERSGFQKLVIINGHESNNTILKYAVRDYSEMSNFRIFYFFYPKFEETWKELCESDTWFGMMHACEFETSLMLATHPQLVKMERAIREYPPYSAKYRNSNQQLGELSKSGVFGDPTKADKDKGISLLDRFIREIVKVINEE